jgi:phosphatidylserine/phosphatidylglycerophosphate/cardiolipin synthase-like enzyme
MTTVPRPILSAGHNCWTADAAINSAGLLIDARAYYRAFYHAARQARRYVLIAGWHLDSELRLLRGEDAEGVEGDVRLLPFLRDLCRRTPGLRVYVLAWDYSVNYAWEWEWWQEWKFEAAGGGQIEFVFDAEHAVAASHHQKWVVIDGRLAFVGGLDFCCNGWDDRGHPARHPGRCEPDGKVHDPYHDLMAALTGPAVGELVNYFRERWRAAGAGELDLPQPPDGSPPAVRPAVRLAADRVAFSRTQPQTMSNPNSVLEIRQLYRDAIEAAEQLIYIENQYFSSQDVFQALIDRMRAPDRSKLDVVMLLPRRLPSWVEAAAMGPPRLWMLDALRQTARETGHRLGLYASVAPDGGCEVPVLIHSKLLLVDDRFLTLGSANASNRSMGLDTELNVAFEARTDADRPLVRSIRRVRVNLLAEHCGLWGDRAGLRELRRPSGLVDFLDRLADGRAHRLRHLSRDGFVEDREWLEALERWGFAFDPGQPVIEEMVHELLALGGRRSNDVASPAQG